jgi:hypothetical protein
MQNLQRIRTRLLVAQNVLGDCFEVAKRLRSHMRTLAGHRIHPVCIATAGRLDAYTANIKLHRSNVQTILSTLEGSSEVVGYLLP